MEQNAAKKRRRKRIAALVLLLCANALFAFTLWLLSRYDQISLDQIFYQLKTPAKGTSSSLLLSTTLLVSGITLGLTALDALLYAILSGALAGRLERFRRYRAYRASRICRFFYRRLLPLSLAVLLFSTGFFTLRLGALQYFYDFSTKSDFFEEHYTDPRQVALTFPERKRNLIYIFLESMENTFSDPTAGGKITADFIPELTALREEGVSFSHTADKGGFYPFDGATWTAAAMVAQTAGVPIKITPATEEYGKEGAYMSGLTSLGDLLADAGYAQTLLLGSNASFAARDSYFNTHGDYRIVDFLSLKEEGRLPADYEEWWGYEDEKLFTFAKEEILRLAAGDAPFNFTMLTADTHFPDGYLCSLCKEEHDEQYANVLSCSSRQIASFITWLKAQPFYEDTAVVLVGDHLTMDPEFLSDIEEDYVRTSYNCFLNASPTPAKEKHREFSPFDLFPTTLAAMGVSIEGERLGLGTNLFSTEQTLTERYGYEALCEELSRRSVFYESTFFLPEKED